MKNRDKEIPIITEDKILKAQTVAERSDSNHKAPNKSQVKIVLDKKRKGDVVKILK